MELMLKNICKSYGDKIILKDFSYQFVSGKIYAIVGESGCGKSTLLNIIGLLDKQTSGELWIDGKKNINPRSVTATKIRRNVISYLFQNYALCPEESIEYNLRIGLQYIKHINKKEKMIETLKEVDMNHSLTTKIYNLSGGEQQRVALARLLLKPSHIVLADEPTGNLDKNNAKIVMDILKKLKNENKIIVIVTHDENIAKCCDEVIYLKNYK